MCVDGLLTRVAGEAFLAPGRTVAGRGSGSAFWCEGDYSGFRLSLVACEESLHLGRPGVGSVAIVPMVGTLWVGSLVGCSRPLHGHCQLFILYELPSYKSHVHFFPVKGLNSLD